MMIGPTFHASDFADQMVVGDLGERRTMYPADDGYRGVRVLVYSVGIVEAVTMLTTCSCDELLSGQCSLGSLFLDSTQFAVPPG